MLPWIDKGFDGLGEKLGASADELKLVATFFLSYPLAAILKRLPDSRPERKNLFCISISLFYLVVIFDAWGGLATLTVSAGGAYCIARFLRSSPFMPWIGFLFLLAHMSVTQLRHQFSATPGGMDIAIAQMVLVMKLSAFCWNVADGQLPDSLLTDSQRDRRLKELPGLLDYSAYVLFFPCLFAGPSFDFVMYRRWLDATLFDVPALTEHSKKPPVRRKRKIPRSGTASVKKAAAGLLWLCMFLALCGRFDHTVLTLDSYADHGFFYKVWLLYMVGFVARLKFYGAWSLTEGACVLTGLGYNGVDQATGKVSWNRLQNVDPWAVETAQNSRAFLAGWNMNTNNWLRNYVYLRVTPRGKKPGFRASLLTFTTSALWHGFHPGYYLSFILVALCQTVAKNFRRYIRPFFLDPITGKPRQNKVYYDCMSWIVTQATFAFAMAPFLVLSFAGSLRVWASVHFYVLVAMALSMIFFLSPAKGYLKFRLDARQRRLGDKLVRNLSQDSLTGREPVLGVSVDPERDISEAVDEMMAELEKKKA